MSLVLVAVLLSDAYCNQLDEVVIRYKLRRSNTMYTTQETGKDFFLQRLLSVSSVYDPHRIPRAKHLFMCDFLSVNDYN